MRVGFDSKAVGNGIPVVESALRGSERHIPAVDWRTPGPETLSRRHD